MYPVGISSPSRVAVVDTAFGSIQIDLLTAALGGLSTLFITAFILTAQLFTLNRSYMATMGCIAAEWKLLDKDTVERTNEQFGAPQPAPWDPRRRYKKGDLVVVYNYLGFLGPNIYVATLNAPEGRPSDLFMEASYDFFRYELGHPSNSRVVVEACRAICYLMGVILLIIFVYAANSIHFKGLSTLLLANLCAATCLVEVGSTNKAELRKVAAEIKIK